MQGTSSFTYEYDAANQLVRENLYYGSGNANNATYTYEYDDWGNILYKKKYAYTTSTLPIMCDMMYSYSYGDSQWGDRLTSFNNQTITYDASGNLVAVVYKVGSGTSYIYYYLRNAQGDIVKLIDSSGNTVVEYLYDSWGRIIATTGSLANTVGANQPFRYRGYVYDEETGWYYLQSRYYDPTTCRFISADVLLSTGQGVLGHNSFAYCNNNTVSMTDDGGDAPWSWLLKDWGYIHRKVQDRICKNRETCFMNYPCSTGMIDIVDISNNRIWEVKSCGPVALFATNQLNRYLSSDGHFSAGTGIAPECFEEEAPNGKEIVIMYWEAKPGVILYAWGASDDEMLREARLAAGGAAAITALYGINKLCKIIKTSVGVLPPITGGAPMGLGYKGILIPENR